MNRPSLLDTPPQSTSSISYALRYGVLSDGALTKHLIVLPAELHDAPIDEIINKYDGELYRPDRIGYSALAGLASIPHPTEDQARVASPFFSIDDTSGNQVYLAERGSRVRGRRTPKLYGNRTLSLMQCSQVPAGVFKVASELRPYVGKLGIEGLRALILQLR